jgi:hypothetical protein
MEMSEMNVHYLDKSGYLRYAFVQALSAFEKLPLVGLTTSIGFMAWLTAVLGLWLAHCKAKPVLPVPYFIAAVMAQIFGFRSPSVTRALPNTVENDSFGATSGSGIPSRSNADTP